MGSTRTTVRPVALATAGLAAVLAVAGWAGAPGSTRASGASGASRSGAPAPAVPAPVGRGRPSSGTDGSSAPFDGRTAPAPDEVDPAEVPDSTFAMDVDTASYGYAKTVLADGGLPSPDRVRPEEFVNAFRQDYPQPRGDGFTVSMDGARLPREHRTAGGDVRLLRVGLQTRAEDRAARPDAALTVVVDVSGSMGDPGKLDVVREALHALVDAGRPDDSLAIVTFSDEARVVQPMTSLRERGRLHAAIDELRAEGSTGLEDGLVAGYRVAREGFRAGATNRVVLLSDGLANVGATDADSILGQGRGQAPRGGAQAATLLGVAVGRDFGDDRVDGGEVFAGHAVTALYLVRLRPGADGPVAHTQLRWQDPSTHEARETGADVAVGDLGGALEQAAPRLQADYAAAFFAEQLRDGPDRGAVPAGYLARLAARAADRTDDGDVRELADLIGRTAD